MPRRPTSTASPAKRKREEDALQRAVFAHLRTRPAVPLVAFHCPNGGFRSKAEAAILQGLGVLSGVPDVIVIAFGTAHGLELKRAGEEPSDAQRKVGEQWVAAGGQWAWADSVDGAIAILESWGLLRGVAAIRRRAA